MTTQTTTTVQLPLDPYDLPESLVAAGMSATDDGTDYAIVAQGETGIEWVGIGSGAAEVAELIAADQIKKLNDLDNGYDPMYVDTYSVFFKSPLASGLPPVLVVNV